MKKYEIVSVGSACIDLIVRNNFETSKGKLQLKLGTKHLIEKTEQHIGGAGYNTSASFAKKGFKTALLCKLGKDILGEYIKKQVKENKVDFIGKTGEKSTGCSIILSQPNRDRTILVHKGANNYLSIKDVPNFKAKWIYFGSLLGESWKTQCKIAKEHRESTIVFNPSHYVAEKGMEKLMPLLKYCTLLIFNKQEAEALLGKNGNVKSLLKELEKTVPEIVITQGAKGAHAIKQGKIWKVKPKNIKVADPTGAGDAFASGYITARILEKDTPTALQWGAAQANSILTEFGATNTLLNLSQLKKRAKENKVIQC